MLGLGLGSHKASALRSLAAKLLAKLRGRSTYYENNQGSKDTIHEIDNYELLDKATILLTPTATSDARVHSVKTYTGDELVTNGSFDTDSDWFGVGSNGWSISNGKARRSGYSVNSDIRQSFPVVDGGTYKFSYTRSYESGEGVTNIYIQLDNANYSTLGNYSSTVVEEHTVEGYFTTTFTGNLLFRIFGINNFTGTIDNISVVEVSSDFDFDRASSATRINSDGLVQDMQSITDPELVLNGDFEELGDELITNGGFDTDSGWSFYNADADTNTRFENNSAILDVINAQFTRFISTTSPMTVGKFYKITYEVTETDGTNLSIQYPSVSINSSIGTHTVYIKSTNVNIGFAKTNVGKITIDNVSVKQVDPNDRWTIYESGSSTVTFTDVASINIDGSNSNAGLYQENVFENNKTYEIVLTMKATATFDAEILETQGAATETTIGDVNLTTSYQDFIFYFTATGTNDLFIHRKFGQTDGQNQQILISNVSVKDITFSTDVDLARINYDSNGENGHILLEPTSTNLIPYSEDFSEWTYGNYTTQNYATAPDGSMTASLLDTSTGTGTNYIRVLIDKSNSATHSVWVKAAPSDSATHIRITNNNTAQWNTGTSKKVALTTEWQRIDVTDGISGNVYFIIGSAKTDSTIDTDCQGKSLIWGAQLEELDYATSYIPTLTGSTVTRAAETLNGSGNSTLINTTQGTIYLESKLGGTTGTKLFSIGGGTNNGNPAVTIGYTGQNMYMDIVDSGSLIATPGDRTITGINLNSYNKMAIKYTTTNVTVYLNGVQKHTETIDFTPATNVLEALYAGYGTGSKFEGEVKALAVFNEALSDTELANLTS